MEISSGILILFKDKILLAHPTRSSDNMWGIPKGKVEDDETLLDTALRETREEIGLNVPKETIINIETPRLIEYRNKKNRIYKKVYYFISKVDDLSILNLESESIPKEKLQLREIDKARFFTRTEAESKIFWRFKEFLTL
jgi:8-oxo-dGTP pyrophosphatase MutT (NUDIX family)